MTPPLEAAPVRVPILMYHAISEKASRAFKPFAVTPGEFASQVAHIAKAGYTSYTVSGFLQAAGAGTLKSKPVILTFDDGFADFHHTAIPILASHAVRATLYVVSGAVGGVSHWLASAGEGRRPLLDWRQLALVAKAGIEVGAHTQTHPALDLIPAAHAREEIAGSKRTIEEGLGIKVESFAYPYGYYSRQVRQMVEDANYSSACAVNYAMSSTVEDRFLLSRHIVRRGTSIAGLSAILQERSPLSQLLHDRWRTRAWRAVRHVAVRLDQRQANP